MPTDMKCFELTELMHAVLDGEATIESMGQAIFDALLRVASGERTRSELLGLGDHEFVPWQIGIMS